MTAREPRRTHSARAMALVLPVLGLALLASPARAQSFSLGGEDEKADDRPRTLVVEPGEEIQKKLPEGVHPRRYKDYRKNQPKEAKDRPVRVTLETMRRAGSQEEVTFIAELTPLNAKGEPHGTEHHWDRFWNSRSRRTPYENGVKHGVEKIRNTEGTVVKRIPWKNGKVHGTKKAYHPNGELASKAPFKNGKAVGTARFWDQDGRLTRTVSYENGERHGPTKELWPGTEQVKRLIPHENGEVDGVAKAYYKSGQLKWRRAYEDDALHGVAKRFDPDGQLVEKVYWLDGEKVSREAYEKAMAEDG